MGPVEITGTDWQAVAAEYAGENLRLRVALQAAGREMDALRTRLPEAEPDGGIPGTTRRKEGVKNGR